MSKNTGSPSDRLPKKNAITRTVLLANDTEVGEQYKRLKQKVSLLEIRLTSNPESPALNGQLHEAIKELEAYEPTVIENSIKFKFRAIGRKRMDALIRRHPPTPEQEKEAEEQKQKAIAAGDTELAAGMALTWNYETFMENLIATTMVEPMEYSEDNLEEIVDWLMGDEWTGAEIGDLFSAALQANNSSEVLQMGKDSKLTRS
jgi:hypothetical protein